MHGRMLDPPGRAVFALPGALDQADMRLGDAVVLRAPAHAVATFVGRGVLYFGATQIAVGAVGIGVGLADSKDRGWSGRMDMRAWGCRHRGLNHRASLLAQGVAESSIPASP